ncbi:uncharacterized protein LOC122881111 [Siniperca chuatsi]|uniref:uncharacterized protein LOC122881111 n=1 Tax=Siniperca chuatsi TaxID=119488 RepID=UPI001CE19A5E|nr:uncharacterized protein LOC122881111 [Siniperca chuatsi]XP_044062809.1 uncharacterized protein LOC122881111 [Siniperca chuatsi]
MPWRCCVPGCKGYDEAKSMGVVFHGLPTRDPQRCRTWLTAIQNPRFDENTPVSRYSGVRVCSLHFKPEDYEEDFRAKILNITPKPMLKSGAVPSVFPGRRHAEPGRTDSSPPAPKRSRPQTVGGGAGSSSQPAPQAAASAASSDESFCIVVSVDDSFHSEPEFSSVTTSDDDDDVDEDCTVVYNRSLMELFRMCQTCGQPLVEKELFHSGAQMRVKWSCRGGHSGVWKSSPHLRDVLRVKATYSPPLLLSSLD